MADTDADEKIRMRKCGWGIKRGWENADGDKTRMGKCGWGIKRGWENADGG